MPAEGTLLAALRAIADATEPLVARLATPDEARTLFWDLGVEIPAVPPSVLELRPLAISIQDAVAQVDAVLVGAGEFSPAALGRITALATALSALFARAAALPGRLIVDFAAYPAFLAEVDLDGLARRLIDLLIVDLFAARWPTAFNLLVMFGVFEVEECAAEGESGTPHIRRRINYDRIGRAFSDPMELLAVAYEWGGADFDAELLLDRLRSLTVGLGLRAAFFESEEGDAALAATAALLSGRELRLVLVRETGEEGALELGFALGAATAGATGLDPGLVLRPYGTGGLDLAYELSENTRLELRSDVRLDSGIALVLRPPSSIELGTGGGVAATLAAKVTWHPADGARITLFSQPDWFRLDSGGFAAGLLVTMGTDGRPRLTLDVGLVDGAARLGGSESDGFIQSLLPSGGLKAEFDIAIGWASDGGVTFSGAGGLEVTIPLHLSVFGVVTIDAVHLALRLAAGGLEGGIALDAGATLGPFNIAVQEIGLDLALALGAPGALGLADLLPHFKPPKGLGLAIDAGPVVGGGFIEFDRAHGRYSGLLQLEMFGVGVTAIGILDTRDSEGQPLPPPGFSFLLIISAEFEGLQLGFGFVLTGVGGLVGIHRTMAIETLRSGVRDGSVDHIMFPSDPARNMPQIISDLRAFFPVALGRYIFGPMARLGWGTPSLFEGELAILIEFPSPVMVALIGQLNVALPTQDEDIVSLHVSVLGIIDFSGKLLSIDASLYDSRVASFSIYGDMAMRLGWGDRPAFALSIGGLNPHFQPPPNFPSLRRATVSLGLGDNPRIGLQAYMAVTSNSIQFGAAAEMYAAAGPLNIYGWLRFDALVTFSPFHFEFAFTTGFALRWDEDAIGGISISGLIAGPSPLRIQGEACVSILFFDICIGFDITIGEQEDVPLPAKNPWEPLKAAIADAHNWSATLTPDIRPAVRIREPKSALVLVHPMGLVTLRQRVVPLNCRIEKFGEFRIVGADRFDVKEVRVGTATVDSTPVKEFFAPGQFEELSNGEKLSRNSFEQMDAGVTVGSTRVTHGAAASARVVDLRYKTTIIDRPNLPARPVNRPTQSRDAQIALSGQGALAASPLRHTGNRKFADPQRRKLVTFDDESYGIASTFDSGLRLEFGKGLSKTIAYQILKKHIEDYPEDAGTLQVVPLSEMDSAA